MPDKLVRFDLDSHQATELILAGPNAIAVVNAIAVSPDGTLLALRDGARWLTVVPAVGGQPRRVFRMPHNTGELSWSPDQRYLLFPINGADAGLDSVSGVARVSVTGGEPEKIDISVKGQIRLPALDPSGRSILMYQAVGVEVAELWALENFLPASTPRK